MIQADYIWDDKASSPVVCLPDTGVDYKHPDLKGKVIKGYDFYNMDKIAGRIPTGTERIWQGSSPPR